jgi:uncharacterized protein YdgA (DUF945 family)
MPGVMNLSPGFDLLTVVFGRGLCDIFFQRMHPAARRNTGGRMKKILVVLMLAAGLYVGVSYVLGGQVRERYFRALEENAGGMVALSNQSYERGLFTSRATTLVELRVPGEPGGGAGQARSSRFAVNHDFRHGPFPAPGRSLEPVIALVDSRVEPVADGSDVDELFREFPELAGTTSTVRVGLDGAVQGDLLVPAFERSAAGERVQWGGLTVTASQDPATGALRGEYAAAGVTAETAAGTLVLEGLSGSFDVVEALPMVFVGRVEGALASLSARDAGTSPVILTGTTFTSDSEMQGDLVHYRQKIGIERIEAEGLVGGPVLCDVETRNLDAAALSELQTGIRGLYEPGLDADEVSRRVEELYVRFFGKVLAGSPHVTVHALRVPTTMGGMEATLDLRLDAPEGISLANILLLLGSLDVAAEFRVDESLLVGLARLDLEGKGAISGQDADLDDRARRVVAGQIDPLIARNLLVRDGGVLKTNAVLRQGRLMVNGQETPLF